MIDWATGVPGSQAFSSLEEQRSHARSDWHRFNVKARASGKSAISEADFERLVSSGQDEVRNITQDLAEARQEAPWDLSPLYIIV